MFDAKFDVLLYDLTSTYFETDTERSSDDLRLYGYSRDKRGDSRQVVIALIVTPEGFLLSYEVLAGNTADSTTLSGFLDRIEQRYGHANRIWVMDRGIPTEDSLAKMRTMGASYLVGTPKGRLTKLQKAFLAQPWAHAREGVQVKRLATDEDVYVLAQSDARIGKERGMRRRRLRRYVDRLKALETQQITRDQLLMKLGAARHEAGRAAHLIHVTIVQPDAAAPTVEAVTGETDAAAAKVSGKKARRKSTTHNAAATAQGQAWASLEFLLDRAKLCQVRRREGRYLLRTNLVAREPDQLWSFYIQLTEVEQAFKEVKHDSAVRPIHHSKEGRIEAHVFVAFLAYCLHVTIKAMLKPSASGITPREVIAKVKTIQMVDVHIPTADGRELLMPRYTQPEADHRMLLDKLGLMLPEQPPPRISAHQVAARDLESAIV